MTTPDLSLPIVGNTTGTWGGLLNAYLQGVIPWALPEEFGNIGTGHDGAAIQAAIAALQSTGRAGMCILTQPYRLELTPTVAGNPPVHFWFVQGAMNRQVGTNPTFLGGRLQPNPGFTGPLLQLGTAGNPTSNPVGTQIINPCMNGRAVDNSFPAGLVGLSLSDTSDVCITHPQLANFDPPGSGVAIFNAGSVSVGAAGLTITGGGLIQNCFAGLVADGLGATDGRISSLLMRLCHHGIDLGPSGNGGGGYQIIQTHLVHGSAAAGDFALQLGAGAGDCTIDGNYFDTYGNSLSVVNIVPRNFIMSNNHFLASGLSTGVMVTASNATLRGSFVGNNCDGNASAMTALLKCSGKAGAPSNGVYLGNNVYNHTVSLVSALIDSANVAIPATATATTYVQGNVAE